MTALRWRRWVIAACLVAACRNDDEPRDARVCEEFVVGSERHAGDQLSATGTETASLPLVAATALEVSRVVEQDRRELEDACRRLKQVDPVSGPPCKLTREDVSPSSVVVDIAIAVLDAAPRCRQSFGDVANCLAMCTPAKACEAPASCEDGRLEVDCDGACTGVAPEPLRCDARCDGECSGICQGTTVCDGFCDGQCASVAPDGSCVGECRGRCRMRAEVASHCDGACLGSCSSVCKPEGELRRCNGVCDGSSRPLSCSGAVELPGCELDDTCASACRARAAARAECTIPSLVRASGSPLVLPSETLRLIDAALRVRARGAAFVQSVAAFRERADVLFASLASQDSKAGYCSGELLWIVDNASIVARTNAERAEEVLGSLGVSQQAW